MRARCLCLAVGVLCAAAGARAEVVISDVRIALEPAEGGIVVRQMIVLASDAPGGPEPVALTIPLAEGATDAVLPSDRPREGVQLASGRLNIRGAVPEGGKPVSVIYTLPLTDGRLVFDQRLPLPVGLVHVACLVGDGAGNLQIGGPELSRSERRPTPSGLPALFAVGRQIEDGRILFTVTGFEGRLMRAVAVIVTGLSFGMLMLGLLLWMRHRT